MEFTEQVVIIRTGRFREADLWVRFLSPARGLLTAFAFGGCRSRRRFCGCLDLFNRCLLRVKATRGGQFLSIQEGTLLRGPDRLRRDWERFGSAVNCLKFLEAMGCGPEGAPATHRLVEDVLQLLEGSAPVPGMLPVLFRLRLAAEQGYAPRMDMCATCGADLAAAASATFLVQEGVVQCDACVPLPGPRVRMEREALDVLRFVQDNSPLVWPVASADPEGALRALAPDALMTASLPQAVAAPVVQQPPELIPLADSARTGFAGGASPRFMGSLSGLAFGQGGAGSLDECLCHLPDEAIAGQLAAAPGEPVRARPAEGQGGWQGSSLFMRDPFGGHEEPDAPRAQLHGSMPDAQRQDSIPDAQRRADAFDGPERPGRDKAAVWRQCTRAVDGFIQYHIGLAWEGGRFRRL